MKHLSLSYKIHKKPSRPIRIIQFGEGNFLRAFADCFIQKINNDNTYCGDIAIVKPTAKGNVDKFISQNCLYDVVTRGISEGKTVDEHLLIDSIADIVNPYEDFKKYISYAHLDTLEAIISNTTEAGIEFSEKDRLNDSPSLTFPGKLTQFLYERFLFFSGSPASGLHILPCELIENNADMLKTCILKYASAWFLPTDFIYWLENYCFFHNTLVDRIVSGFPEDSSEEFFNRLGYEDKLLSVAEPFALWVIEDKQRKIVKDFSLFTDTPQLPIIITDDCNPYRERKVRILNGTHTAIAMLAWLCGFDYVREVFTDYKMKSFIENLLLHEISPFVPLSQGEVSSFADSVIERFQNPFMNHSLLSIALNSVSKWRTRCLPSLLDYYKATTNAAPLLTFSLAALLKFYTSNSRNSDGKEYICKDTDDVLSFFAQHKNAQCDMLVTDYLSNYDFHGTDLTSIPLLAEKVTKYLSDMNTLGVSETFNVFMEEYLNEKLY